MDEWLTLRLLALFVSLYTVACGHVFFHEPSSILVKQNYDFGFALSQWNDSLIVSSPSSDLNGTVYKCPLSGIAYKNLTCVKLDLFNSTTYTRDVYPEQHFYLGASIAATKDFLFTCAPMVTKNVTYRDDETTIYSDAVGSCFLYNNSTSTECHGPDSVFRWDENGINEDIFQGGTGWNTLADEENGFLLVAKTSVYGDIFYLRTSGPKQFCEQDPKTVVGQFQEGKETNMLDILSLGYGMTAGKFFSNETVYAFSKQRLEMTGQIVFLEIVEDDDGLKDLRIMLEFEDCISESCIYTINNEVAGGMFGYALGAADLDADSYSELLVGAPLQSDDENEVEFGALHIYLGGDIKSLNDPSRVRTIFGAKAMGRFGSAIATTDTDGDGIAEVFVSAPYEDSGAVYVLSGRELKEELLMPTSALTIQVSEFKHSQRLVRKGVTELGFSLLSMSDVDGNGCNDLAVGAPGASSIILLRCLTTINVNITYELKEPYVKEKVNQTTVNLYLQFRYNTQSNISGKIIAKNYISGAAQLFPNSFTTDLSKKLKDMSIGILIKFDRHEKFIYELTTKLEIENINSLASEDFDTSWAQFGPYSQTENSVRIHRACEGDDCNPNLLLQIKWNSTEFAGEFESKGHKKDTNDSYWYDVESSEEEMISIVVLNKGFEVSEACVWVEIFGAPVHKPGKCSPVPPKNYECALPMPFRRTYDTGRDEAVFEILLNMTSLSDNDKALVVVASPKNKCKSKEIDSDKEKRLVINYSFNKAWEKVHVKGINNSLSVSDIEISENELKKAEENILKDEHQYTITNEGSLLWNRIIAIIQVENRPFITKVGTIEKKCNVTKDENLINFTCPLKLPPCATKKNTPITVWIDISKGKIADELQGGRKINVTSTMKIYMDFEKMSTEPAKFIQESIITDIQLRKETSFGQNQTLIGILAALLAILLLVLIIFCLYKKGFFTRKQKKDLNVLRASVRRHSVRLASEKSSKYSQMAPSVGDDDADIDIEVVEDSPFEEVPISSKDRPVLLAAEVHKEHKKEEMKEEHAKKPDFVAMKS